jgi:hypothetical protein
MGINYSLQGRFVSQPLHFGAEDEKLSNQWTVRYVDLTDPLQHAPISLELILQVRLELTGTGNN